MVVLIMTIKLILGNDSGNGNMNAKISLHINNLGFGSASLKVLAGNRLTT